MPTLQFLSVSRAADVTRLKTHTQQRDHGSTCNATSFGYGIRGNQPLVGAIFAEVTPVAPRFRCIIYHAFFLPSPREAGAACLGTGSVRRWLEFGFR